MAEVDEVAASDELTALSRRAAVSPAGTVSAANRYGVCPDNAIIKLADSQYAVDCDYCKGCGLCAAECPCGALEMEPEQT